HGAHAFLLVHPGSLAAVSEPAQKRKDCRRVSLFSSRRDPRQDFFNRSNLLRLVVNHEVRFVTKLFNVPTQDTNAEGVESADGRLSRRRCAMASQGVAG